jgi:signal transduction histidine kinase
MKEEEVLTQQLKAKDAEIFLLKSLLDQVPMSIYWKDSAGTYLGQNAYAANKMREVGFEDQVVGKNDFELYPKSVAESYRLNDEQVMSLKKELAIEEPVTTPKGDLVQLSTKKPLYDQNGVLVGIVGMTRDITDRKRREALEAERLEYLQNANDTMRFWAGAIAHEIRTPLMSIALMADSLDFFIAQLIHDYPDLWKDSPRKATSLEYIQKLPKNFAEITKSMNHFVDMALMKVSPEKSKKHELKPMRIKESVMGVIEAYPFKKINDDKNERDLVHINILDDFSFNGDETLFRHLIYNLMKNAIYFVRKANKGEIFIEAIADKSTDKNHNPMNYLYFKDTGPGIPEENLQHLFKAFFSRSQNGTGVGLSLCKSIMNEFGGSISCESVEGEFTKFVMAFPKG